MTEWIRSVTSMDKELFYALLAAVFAHLAAKLLSYIQRRLSGRRSGSAGSEDSPLVSPPPDVRTRRRPAHARAGTRSRPTRTSTRVATHALNMTPEQEADLIRRGMPERLVRNGNLDYPSFTSGSMADRIRNGYA